MEVTTKKKYSEWGLASFCIFLINAIIWTFLFLTGSIGNYQITSIIWFSSLGLLLLAFIFGLIGLLQRNRKNSFPF